MINLKVEFDPKAYNKRSDIKDVIRRLQKIEQSSDKEMYVCADTLNNCLWVCGPEYQHQILLD